MKGSKDLITDNTLIFETLSPGGNGEKYIFQNPKYIYDAFSIDDVEEAITNLQAKINEGFYCAGYISYEAGFAFENSLKKLYKGKIWDKPILWFGVFENKEKFTESRESHSYSTGNFIFNHEKEEYRDKIERIKTYIKNGITYQINYTGKIKFEFEGESFGMYSDLKKRQSAGYTAFIRNIYGDILSFSPELFFKKDDIKIISKPMKGTAKRGKNISEDLKITNILRESEKDCAENVMIVDLIRNDMGKISEFGSVKVKKLVKR